jgi:hypothetical protein
VSWSAHSHFELLSGKICSVVGCLGVLNIFISRTAVPMKKTANAIYTIGTRIK